MRPKILSCGVVVVRRENDRWLYLLLRAYNYWDFPKGQLEEGETPLEAARREVEEETTIAQLTFPWGRECIETPPYRGGKVARYYLAQTEQMEVNLPVNPQLGRPEHHEYRWVGAHTAWRLLTPRVRQVLAWARERLGELSPKGGTA